jgi:hypothetical protein
MNESIPFRAAPGRPILVDSGQLALARIGDLIRGGGSPEHVAREVETIVSTWQVEAVRAPEEVRQRLAACCDYLGAGVAWARGKVENLGGGDLAALQQGARSLAAMIAARDAMTSACDLI